MKFSGWYNVRNSHEQGDNVKLSNHPTHPSRGKFNKSGIKFYLTDFGMQNPNLTLFGTADGN